MFWDRSTLGYGYGVGRCVCFDVQLPNKPRPVNKYIPSCPLSELCYALLKLFNSGDSGGMV